MTTTTDPKSTDPVERVPDADLLDVIVEAVDERLSTIWHNPTGADVVLDLYVGGVVAGRRPRNREEKTGLRAYRIRTNESRAIPSEFDQAIQQTTCGHPRCDAKKRLCRDLEHSRFWEIIGGLGQRLIREGVQPLRIAPALQTEAERLAAPPSVAASAPVASSAEEAALRRAKERLAR